MHWALLLSNYTSHPRDLFCILLELFSSLLASAFRCRGAQGAAANADLSHPLKTPGNCMWLSCWRLPVRWWRLGALFWTFVVSIWMRCPWRPMQGGNSSAGKFRSHRVQPAPKQHLGESTHLPPKPAGLGHGQRAHGWVLLCRLPPGKHFVSSGAVQREKRLEKKEQPCLTKLPSLSITVLPGHQGVMETSSLGPITSAKLSPGECLLSVLACWLQVTDFYTDARLQVTVFHSRISIFLLANEDTCM